MTYAAIVMSQVELALPLLWPPIVLGARKSARGSFAVGHNLSDRESLRET